jgi:hypothetical protein
MLTKEKLDEIDDSLEHSSRLSLRCIAQGTRHEFRIGNFKFDLFPKRTLVHVCEHFVEVKGI